MIAVDLDSETDFAGWRTRARSLLAADVQPGTIAWRTNRADRDLFGEQPSPLPERDIKVRVPRQFLTLAERAACHRDTERFARLYRLLYRLHHRECALSDKSDPDIIWLEKRDKAVRRDIHKMHAFVRFRASGVSESGREQFGAWFEPDNYIEELAVPFFVRRFPNMDWLIVTPRRTARYIDGELTYTGGGARDQLPAEDAVEDQWRTYFASIFNPARLKTKAMTAEMPKRYWKNLPEAQLIPSLIASSTSRAREMQAAAPQPANPRAATIMRQRELTAPQAEPLNTLAAVNAAARTCTHCDLCRHASQTVLGEGPQSARLMIVGEQPGDQEDIAGRPFIGPAGKLLDQSLAHAGIERSTTYLTNAVKHFKFTPRGKRRIHSKPNAGEIDQCRWWLNLEREFVQPEIILAMGATALRGVLGRAGRLTDYRGQTLEIAKGVTLLTTVHPAYLLRLPDADRREQELARFRADLAQTAMLLEERTRASG